MGSSIGIDAESAAGEALGHRWLTGRRSVGLLAAVSLTFALAACAPEPGQSAASGSGDSSSSQDGASNSKTDADSSSEAASADAKEDEAGAEENSAGEESKGGEGGNWTAENPEDVDAKHTDLPEGFPSDRFVIPQDASIDNTGARSESAWFIVFRAADSAAASKLWADIISGSGLTIVESSVSETGETTAMMSNPSLNVEGMTIQQEGKDVLLNYELSLSS